jgi:thymidylate kinase
MKTLVVGCDASGKSTLINAISRTYGDTFTESTQSKEAREFKLKYHNTPLSTRIIDEREQMYLKLSALSHKAELQIRESGSNIVTSDCSLVTRLSHGVMREVMFGKKISDDEIIGRWCDDEAVISMPPDLGVLASPPFRTILDRIRARQSAGDQLESFRGFNSVEFLDAYNRRWKSVFPELVSIIPATMIIDTSVYSPEEAVGQYDEIRAWVG